MGIKFTNFATSTIANVGGIVAGATSLDVQAGDGELFPSTAGGGYFYCVIVDTSGNREVVKCTARSVDTLTITRAQDGTTALPFDQNSVVELRLTKGALEEFADVIVDLTTHVASEHHFPVGTVMIFGQNSAPSGWTRKSDWQDNAMLCYASASNIGNGGSANPQSGHTHTGPSHSHTVPSHAHTGPSHNHVGAEHIHTTGSHALTVAELPAHTHTYTSVTTTTLTLNGGVYSVGTVSAQGSATSGSTGSGSAHSHGDTGLSSPNVTGSGGTGSTGSYGPDSTSAAGTGATGSNTSPYYQEVIAATRDAF